MAFLALIFTSPFVLITYDRNHKEEKYFILKLFGIWLLCQIYILINNDVRLPIGFIADCYIVFRTPLNRSSKIKALLLGVISFMLSYLVYRFFVK